MEFEAYLLWIVQILAVSTFIGFVLIVFLPNVHTAEAFRYRFFSGNGTSRSVLILSSLYAFLFSHLFMYGVHEMKILVYAGFICSVVGLLLAFVARIQLRKHWSPITRIEASDFVVESGVYAVIRHPIYVGRLLFFVGVFCMTNVLGLLLAPMYWEYLRLKLVEEEDLLKAKNPRYQNYLEKTKQWIF